MPNVCYHRLIRKSVCGLLPGLRRMSSAARRQLLRDDLFAEGPQVPTRPTAMTTLRGDDPARRGESAAAFASRDVDDSLRAAGVYVSAIAAATAPAAAQGRARAIFASFHAATQRVADCEERIAELETQVTTLTQDKIRLQHECLCCTCACHLQGNQTTTPSPFADIARATVTRLYASSMSPPPVPAQRGQQRGQSCHHDDTPHQQRRLHGTAGGSPHADVETWIRRCLDLTKERDRLLLRETQLIGVIDDMAASTRRATQAQLSDPT